MRRKRRGNRWMVSCGRITADLNVFACKDDDAKGENAKEREKK